MKRFALILFAAALIGVLLVGWKDRRRLTAENARLQAAAADLDSLRQETLQSRNRQDNASELERARQSQSELLRLRGEVSQLREQVKKEREARAAAERKAAIGAAVQKAQDEAIPPVETFSATLRASLAPQQSLVTGGWTLPSGNRAIVMVEPALIDSAGNLAQPGEANQVVVQARFAEIPDALLDKVGLQSMRTSGRESTAQSVLEANQQQRLREQLEKSQGVNLLSAPLVTTLDGRQARVDVTRTRNIGGVDYELGPSLDFVPKISADGKTVDMTVTARIRQATAPAE